jgi:hypothetical protein
MERFLQLVNDEADHLPGNAPAQRRQITATFKCARPASCRTLVGALSGSTSPAAKWHLRGPHVRDKMPVCCSVPDAALLAERAG